MSPKEPSEIKIKELISLFEKKKFDELLRFSNELLDEFPNSILIQNIKGIVYTELKNYKLAKSLYGNVFWEKAMCRPILVSTPFLTT